MSEYEKVRGKIKKVVTDNVEEYCKNILKEKGEDLDKMPSWDHSYLEWLTDQYDENYVKLNGELYTLEDYERIYDPEHDYCILKNLPDGSIEFETQFYNGGTCWEEMVEDELAE